MEINWTIDLRCVEHLLLRNQLPRFTLPAASFVAARRLAAVGRFAPALDQPDVHAEQIKGAPDRMVDDVVDRLRQRANNRRDMPTRSD